MGQSSHLSSGKSASVLTFLSTIMLTTLCLVYFSITAYTKDALWFYPVFDKLPVLVTIRCYGSEITFESDSIHLINISEIVNKQISGDKRWQELNLTDQTYTDYMTSSKVLLLLLEYNEPQRIHSQSPFFSGFDTLLIPLDARHASSNIMFNLIKGRPAGGSFVVEAFQPVSDYIFENDLCKKE